GGIGQTMFFRVPEMDTRLVANLDPGPEASKPFRQLPDDLVLGPPRRIGIEVENIVIVDAVVDGAAGQNVPDRLHQTSRDEPRIRQREAEQFIDNGFVNRIAKCSGEECVAVHRWAAWGSTGIK